MRLSLRDYFALTLLIAVALVGILSFRENLRFEALRITRERELATLEGRKRELEVYAKYETAIDRIVTPLQEKYETVKPRDETTLSIHQLPSDMDGWKAPFRFQVYIPSAQPVYLKWGVVSVEPKASPKDPIAQGSNVFRAGLLDQPAGNKGLDFDQMSDASRATSNELRLSEFGLPVNGPYQLKLPSGMCGIEMTRDGELCITLNSSNQARYSFSPMRPRGSWSFNLPTRSNSAQCDYHLNSALPGLALVCWDESYKSALWFSKLNSDFEPFPPGVDP